MVVRLMNPAHILRAVVLSLAVAGTTPGWTFFSDDEARRAILDLRVKVDTLTKRQEEIAAQVSNLASQGQSTVNRLDEMTPRISDTEVRLQGSGKGQLQLLNENEKLRTEIAALRGQIEQLLQQATQVQQSQKDFYTDLDRRLKTIEPVKTAYTELDRRLKSIEPVTIVADGQTLRVSPLEADQFRSLQDTFRGNDTKATLNAALRFEQQFPGSAVLPHVLLLRGTTLYIAKNYSEAIVARQEFLRRFPNHPGSVQAAMNLAASQAESGDIPAAKKTLQAILSNNPEPAIAAEAKLRLETLPAQ
jgi:TolA-binding protein